MLNVAKLCNVFYFAIASTKGDPLMTFTQLNLNQTLLHAIKQGGYNEATPIQQEAIPHILNGKDILGSAQTGTGKTAAFALPILEHIHAMPAQKGKKKPTALVLAPTRELALQIKESFHKYSSNSAIKTVAVYGGVPKRKQIISIKRGVDVIIATPGRLLDLINMKVIKLDTVQHFVLDEADRMLDMGFIHDVKTITEKLPSERQTMLFSATLPKSILTLSKTLLNHPVRVEIAKDNAPLESIDQSVFFVKKVNKAALLKEVLQKEKVINALVFIRTKQGANRLVKALTQVNVYAEAIHGNKTQSQRQTTLNRFKQGKINVLVATDVASRGIDIDKLSHVINYDLPETAETYLHRIGRTARAGRLGSSLSFCSPEETHLLKAIQKHISMIIPVDSTHSFPLDKPINKSQTQGNKKGNALKFDSSKYSKRNKNKRNFNKKKSYNKPAHNYR